MRKSLGNIEKHRAPQNLPAPSALSDGGLQARLEGLPRLRSQISDDDLVGSLGCGGSLVQAPAAGQRASFFVKGFSRAAADGEKVKRGRVLRTGPTSAHLVLSSWANAAGNIVVPRDKVWEA